MGILGVAAYADFFEGELHGIAEPEVSHACDGVAVSDYETKEFPEFAHFSELCSEIVLREHFDGTDPSLISDVDVEFPPIHETSSDCVDSTLTISPSVEVARVEFFGFETLNEF